MDGTAVGRKEGTMQLKTKEIRRMAYLVLMGVVRKYHEHQYIEQQKNHQAGTQRSDTNVIETYIDYS